jgi:hypothetical protein
MVSMETLTLAIGAYVLGAVYLGGVIATGLVWGSPAAVVLSLVAAGAGYLVQAISVLAPERRTAIQVLWSGSVVAAVASGVLLLA